MDFNDTIFEFDNTQELLNFRFSNSGIPLYFIVRQSLLREMINRHLKLDCPHVENKKFSVPDALHYIFHTVKNNLFLAPRRDIYIFSSGIVNTLDKGEYINRLYSDIADAFSNKIQILESSTKKKYLLPKKKKMYYSDLINLLIIIASKFFLINSKDSINIDKFIHFIINRFNIEENIFVNVKYNLRKLARREKASFFIYKLFFMLKRPKLIIVEGGYYGDQYMLIYVAKTMGIKVAEYQHGSVGALQPAYNYSEVLYESMESYYPEYFLTFGKYWGRRIRIPAIKYEIGLPLLEKKSSKIRNRQDQKIIVLFISTGTGKHYINEVLESIVLRMNRENYHFIFRPHPSEVSAVEERYGGVLGTHVELDEGALYDSLNRANIVVGFAASTVLYEAVCFTDQIYLMNNPAVRFYEKKIEELGFLLFSNSDELIYKIKKKNVIQLPKNYIWADNWKCNFNNFLKDVIGISYDSCS